MARTLLDELAEPEARDAYDKLPESIKSGYSRREWMWLTDREKAWLVTTECSPEVFDD